MSISLATILLSTDRVNLEEVTYTRWVKIVLITLGRSGVLKVPGV
jgi:hypothetical protein